MTTATAKVKEKLYIRSEETRKKMSLAQTGKRHSEETKKKISEIQKGIKRKPRTLTHRQNLSVANLGPRPHLRGERAGNWRGGKPKCCDCGKTIWYESSRCKKCFGLATRGEKSPNWKGTLSETERIRKSVEYKAWRHAVFQRDNFTCVFCGQRGKRLHADHIKRFALYPELRLELSNGRTLCVQCHKKTDTFAGKGMGRLRKQLA